LGSGAREHAIVWKLKQDPRIKEIFVFPGNAGTSKIAKNVELDANNIEDIAKFIVDNAIDIVIPGQEIYLVKGIKDLVGDRSFVFGPSKKASNLESSKDFAKSFMSKYEIPTANYGSFTDPKKALNFIEDIGYPAVIKADGLASGKGVVIVSSRQEASQVLEDFMVKNKLGESGKKVVIEEFLRGEEASYIIAIKDGKFGVLPTSQDHKRLKDNDEGPNTGGMGAYSPAPIINKELDKKIIEKIVKPVMYGLEQEGLNYTGFLYIGLMISEGEPYVLEFNVRLGDPEAQVLMMRLKKDLLDIVNNPQILKDAISDEFAAGVVMACKNYPYSSCEPTPIRNLEKAQEKGTIIFQANTKLINDEIYSLGGRALTVCATSKDLKEALKKVYDAITLIDFKDAVYRKDIGQKAFKYL
ncbi:MAG: phosphoribosylamine--glycine ligase, partial [Hydrogenobaculum sp.]